MKRYAIYGAGWLGTVLGAYITKNGKPCEIDAINGVAAEVHLKTERYPDAYGRDKLQPKMLRIISAIECFG